MAMENPTRDMCRRLRSKGMFIQIEPGDAFQHSNDGFYWCSRTQRCLGPDGKVVTRETCTPDRDCFEGFGIR